MIYQASLGTVDTFLLSSIHMFLTFVILMKRMFRVFGHDRVWVLDGGLPLWRASGFDVESSASGDAILKASAASEAIEKVYNGQTVSVITHLSRIKHYYLLLSCYFVLVVYHL